MITKHLYKSYSSILFPNLETETIRVEFNFKENMKKLVITEEQFNKNIKKLLNEKLHVSDEVIETKNMIANLIKNRNLYDLAKDNLQSQDNDGFNQILAQIIYLSFKQEHDGYLNGAYATVMWAKPQSKKEVDYYIQQTEIFQVLQMLSYNRQILIDNENNEKLLNALRVFNNKKLNWFLRTSDYSIKRITKNIQGLKKLCYEKLNF